jgi:hypothetical protein
MFSLNEKMKFFRCYSNVYNWKSLAYSIYHIQHLINHFDNYQMKNPLGKQFQYLSDYFILFIKDLITIEIQSTEKKSSSLQFNYSFHSSDYFFLEILLRRSNNILKI